MSSQHQSVAEVISELKDASTLVARAGQHARQVTFHWDVETEQVRAYATDGRSWEEPETRSMLSKVLNNEYVDTELNYPPNISAEEIVEELTDE